MKKYIAILLVAAMATLGISACRKENSNKETKVQKDSDIKVVTTIFPEYDWVRQIAGEEADQMDITMLLDNGVDLHSYQPTAEDIMKVSDCDLFVYVGGESDAWVDDALKQAKNKDTDDFEHQLFIIYVNHRLFVSLGAFFSYFIMLLRFLLLHSLLFPALR